MNKINQGDIVKLKNGGVLKDTLHIVVKKATEYYVASIDTQNTYFYWLPKKDLTLVKKATYQEVSK